ncbi:unnamed protein product [Kuraishia capsulata CBS 1993]|uniref:dihydrolipoyllysine-residue succinyltransferase n=1 Tax=Kuraishia capsulata CBS 1993 TaxID=1382522 RepID=W6MSH8_9ASCO|nr:uncharacterized protein KUCA_T00005662001 [Kuraishia capsulata CBS 1993]CDK29669.1 unnamed protein product [Kuraishia capsulata CBS 1993]
MLRSALRSSTRCGLPLKAVAVSSRQLGLTAARSIQTSVRPSVLRSTVRKSPSPFVATKFDVFVRGNAQIVKVPDMAESITEGTLTSFSKSVGDYVDADETIATIETDKIDVEVNAPIAGVITEFLAAPEDTVEVGQDLLKIEPGEKPEGAAAAAPKKEEAAPVKEEPKEAAAPKAAAPPKPAAPAPTPKKEAPKKEAPKESTPAPSTGSFSRHEERIKMNRMRMRIAERLKEAQNTAASLTTFNEVDMSSLLEMRKLYKDEFLKKTGIKFGFMGAFSKASALAMKDIPAVNGSIENGDTMVFRDYMDISIAVATPKGLVTPVVRNAESLTVLGIEEAIASLGAKARDNKLTLEDMAGGTFTISNGGVFGSLYGTPILNVPQTAVLGLHGVKERPVTVNGKVESRPMMYLALTYDHRMLDGREAVTFLKTVKELIEDPRKMLLM